MNPKPGSCFPRTIRNRLSHAKVSVFKVWMLADGGFVFERIPRPPTLRSCKSQKKNYSERKDRNQHPEANQNDNKQNDSFYAVSHLCSLI